MNKLWIMFSLSDLPFKKFYNKYQKNEIQKNQNKYTKLENEINKYKINILYFAWEYHFKLNYIISKPKIIYFIWDINILNKDILWIVWPRKISIYWKEVLNELFKKLEKYNLATISWLAIWVDTICHNLSIKKNIPTIAVLWWGILYFLKTDFTWKKILNIINNWWLIISEYKLYQEPSIFTFPQRNRIIAWLSKTLFIPEAWYKSWSLITADFANKSNIPIYWATNEIFSINSWWLIEEMEKSNIKISSKKFLFINKYFKKHKTQKNELELFLSNDEKKILRIIKKNIEWINIENIQNQTKIWTKKIICLISKLEINWLISQKWWNIKLN